MLRYHFHGNQASIQVVWRNYSLRTFNILLPCPLDYSWARLLVSIAECISAYCSCSASKLHYRTVGIMDMT